MNIEKAKQIPIVEILAVLKASLVKEMPDSLMYLSSIRNENTGSFHVTPSRNVWFDHGLGEGGDGIGLVCRHLKNSGEDHTIHDALRWLRNMTGHTVVITPTAPKHRQKKAGWIVKTVKPLQNLALVRYAEQRGIHVDLATRFFKEVLVQHAGTGKSVLALGFEGEDGGWELRNPFLKSSVAPKSITFFRGNEASAKGVHLFEGSFDTISSIARCSERLGKANDIICLNSLSNLREAFAYIKGYPSYEGVYSWLDNDRAGLDANAKIAEFVQSQPGLKYTAMNWLYRPHKDVNAWHMAQLNK